MLERERPSSSSQAPSGTGSGSPPLPAARSSAAREVWYTISSRRRCPMRSAGGWVARPSTETFTEGPRASSEIDIEAERLGDEQHLDLAGAVPDADDAGVAPVAAGRRLVHEAGAAVNLDRQVGTLGCDLGAVVLGDERLLTGDDPLPA